jgi:lipid II:glycine glycyltransferase (peptidoglycan interpeptide bridge formation enzyme)
VPGRPLSAAAWDAPLLRAEHASLLQSWRWGEFKRPAGWVPWRLMLYARGENGAPNRPLVAAQVLFRALPHLPLPVSIAYIPRGPVFFSDEDGPARDAFWGAVHAECRRRGAIFLKVEPDTHLSERVTKAEVDRRMSALGFEPAGRLQPARTIVLDLGGGEDLLLK